MNKIFFLLPLAGAILLSGCDKQTKLNTAKIESLSQQMVQFQEEQSRQIAAIQSQLALLTPALDKINGSYFEKSHEDAFFFHTNTLFLILTVDRKIEAQLQAAETQRQAESLLALYYHTNQTDTMYFCAAQIQNAMEAQHARTVEKVNTETRRVGDELAQQIKLVIPDAAEAAWRREQAADLAQFKRDLEVIKARLGITNTPAGVP